MSIWRRLSLCTAAAAVALLTNWPVPAAAGPPTWEDDIGPLFKQRCISCHSGKIAPLYLRLDSYARFNRGSSNGPVVVPGKPGESELIRRLHGQSQPRMPADGPPYLDERTITMVEEWIAAGAPQGVRSGAAVPRPAATRPPKTSRPGKPAVTYADVAPILQERCVMCHSGDTPPKGLRLDSFENVKKGSQRGGVALAGDPGGSELMRRLRGSSRPRMPMSGPPFLTDGQITLFEAWIAGGLQPGPAAAAAPVTRQRPAPGAPVTYADVEPIFMQRCVKCHTDNGQMGPAPEGLRLQRLDQVLAGGERAVVVPGSPGASELVRKVNGTSRPRMPFDGPPYLAEDDVRLITEWVAQGAPDEAGVRAPVPAGARIRLHGTITGPGELDGFRVLDGDGGSFRGGYVRVRGVVTPDGRVRVDRIKGRSGDDDHHGRDHYEDHDDGDDDDDHRRGRRGRRGRGRD